MEELFVTRLILSGYTLVAEFPIPEHFVIRIEKYPRDNCTRIIGGHRYRVIEVIREANWETDFELLLDYFGSELSNLVS